MRILVMGDFSGRAEAPRGGPSSGLESRPLIRVDVDNLEDVLARLAPRLRLPAVEPVGQEALLEFKSLDDFHPDRLYQKLGLFETLRLTRRRLLDPATSGEVIAELTGISEGRRLVPPSTGQSTESSPPGSIEDDESTVERLLGKRPTGSRLQGVRSAGPQVDISGFIRQVVGPHIAPTPHPRQKDVLISLDAATSVAVRGILHHPAFQALESSWLSLRGLVTGVETGEVLEIFILDVTKDELAGDLEAAGRDLDRSGLYRRLLEGGLSSPGEPTWSLIIGDYAFGLDPGDISLLNALGAIASRAGGPFLAEASSQILGCRSIAETPDPRNWTHDRSDSTEAWQSLRRSPTASWVGLALPRVLLRVPYGKKSDPIESFGFEEMLPTPDHDRYLWGNPAFACARLIAKAFVEHGWPLQLGDHLDVENLPSFTYTAGGESEMIPCAEIFLTERAADTILAYGLMPLASYRNRNAARLIRFQSLADPPAPLSGPWAT